MLWRKQKKIFLARRRHDFLLEHFWAVYGLICIICGVFDSPMKLLFSQVLIVFLFVMSPALSQEVDVRDMNSLEAYALSLYEQGQYRQAEQLLNEVARNGDSQSMRDRARYNSSLAAYQQGKLGQALEALDAMEQPNSQSMHNAQYIQKEIEERRKSARQQDQQEEQDQQGKGDSSDQEGEQGKGQQESERQDSSEQESSQQESGQSDAQNNEPQEQGEESGEEGQQEPSEGIPQEALSPEEWSKREAQRLLDSVEEGQHRGFGQEGESSSGTKTW